MEFQRIHPVYQQRRHTRQSETALSTSQINASALLPLSPKHPMNSPILHSQSRTDARDPFPLLQFAQPFSEP